MEDAQGMDHVADAEAAYWDEWNARHRRPGTLDQVPLDQARAIHRGVRRLGRTDLRLLDIGCGTGWLVDQLLEYGDVTGIDVSRDVIVEARQRTPRATFITGDVLVGQLPAARFDVVVSLETLPHVSDQEAFMRELARLIAPGGLIMIAAQNGAVLGRHGRLPPPDPRARSDRPGPQRFRDLAEMAGEVVSIRTITPQGDASWRRVLTSKRLRDVLGPVGRLWHRVLERLGWGRTLVAEVRGR